METCRTSFTVHRTSSETALDGGFKGMASVFQTLIDAYIPTRIQPGAFTKTLRENQKRIKVLYQHNQDWPIGVPTRMEETPDGLYVEAKISQTTMGRDVLQLLRDGVLTELSIGFDPIKSHVVQEPSVGHVRHITEARLWEFSPVSFGANSDARVMQVHRRRPRVDVERRLAEFDRISRLLRDQDTRMLALREFQLRNLALLEAQVPRRPRVDVERRLADFDRISRGMQVRR